MALTQVDAGMLSPTNGQFYSMKSRIINGAMVIDQRNAGASVTPSTGTYTLDRWQAYSSAASKFTVQQNAGSVTPPAGFTNYLGCTSSSAYTVGASDLFVIYQRIEGFNVADLNWGTANAQTVTLSFWVRSSLTGTFGGSLQNGNGNRSYPFTYTINSANTWEQKTITIAGDTTGTWATNNTSGIQITLSIGAGSTYNGTAGAWAANGTYSVTGATSVVGTNGATFYITGVMLEKGSTATSFDYRPYGTELQLCQRYYQKLAGFTCVGGGATEVAISIPFTLPMRASPSVGQTGVLTIEDIGVADRTQSSTSISIRASRINSVGGVFSIGNFSSLTQFRPFIHNVNYSSTDNYITLSAEL